MDRITALGLMLLTCAVWQQADAGKLRGLLFLILITLMIAHKACRYLKYILLLATVHVVAAAYGATITGTKVWALKYTLALSNGMYMVAGVLLILLMKDALSEMD